MKKDKNPQMLSQKIKSILPRPKIEKSHNNVFLCYRDISEKL